MALPSLPVDLQKGDVVLTATTPAEYINLVNGRGFREKELSPQEKAARTRAAKRASGDEQSEQDTSNVPDGATDPAGDATGDES